MGLLRCWFDTVTEWLGVFHKVDLWILDSANQAAARKPRRNPATYGGKSAVAVSLGLGFALPLVRGDLLATTPLEDYVLGAAFVVGAALWFVGERWGR